MIASCQGHGVILFGVSSYGREQRPGDNRSLMDQSLGRIGNGEMSMICRLG
jgi:hypothetical protein